LAGVCGSPEEEGRALWRKEGAGLLQKSTCCMGRGKKGTCGGFSSGVSSQDQGVQRLVRRKKESRSLEKAERLLWERGSSTEKKKQNSKKRDVHNSGARKKRGTLLWNGGERFLSRGTSFVCSYQGGGGGGGWGGGGVGGGGGGGCFWGGKKDFSSEHS